MLARCPNCRATFSTEKSGQQTCPACGKPLIVPEQPVLAASLPPVGNSPGLGDPPSGNAPPPGTPWESRPMSLQSWWATMTLALFEPDTLYAQARLDKRREQTIFAVATFSVFSISGNLLEAVIMRPQQERWLAQVKELAGDRLPGWVMKYLEQSQHQGAGQMVFGFLLAPLIAFLFIYSNAGVTHACANILGQNKRGFEATFAACAYSMAPMVLLAVPACGNPIAVIWTIVLTGVGMKRMHGLTTGGATATALVPYLVLCCGMCLFVIIGVSVLSQVLAGGGTISP